jgi:hypothetical protein
MPFTPKQLRERDAKRDVGAELSRAVRDLKAIPSNLGLQAALSFAQRVALAYPLQQAIFLVAALAGKRTRKATPISPSSPMAKSAISCTPEWRWTTSPTTFCWIPASACSLFQYLIANGSSTSNTATPDCAGQLRPRGHCALTPHATALTRPSWISLSAEYVL